ncbi:MAG: GNAT family N-acetyltransferase [Promethearchaeota archaeon]|jgi:N-acetylglutamate synthase-like GNAT family acetyltransferase
MEIRFIQREEIEKVRYIDRNETVEQIYYYRKGKLVLEDENCEIPGWYLPELEKNIKHLYNIYDRNGTFYGAFDNNKMIGISALESKFIGSNKDQLQLYFLHVDCKHRHKEVGKKLMLKTVEKAKELGAKKLYISATPSKNTIDFYMHMGCELTKELNPELYELEPDDIHLDLII